MQEDKNGFLLYTSYLECIGDLSREEKGALFEAILIYESTGEIIELDCAVRIAFSFIKKDLDLNREKYIKKCERNQQNSKLGGRPKNDNSQNKENFEVKNRTVFEKTERFEKKPNGFLENQTVLKKPDNDNEDEDDNDFSFFKKEKDAQTSKLFDPYCGEYILLFEKLYKEVTKKPFVPDKEQRKTLSGYLATLLQDCGKSGIKEAILRVLNILNKLTFDMKKPYLPWLLKDGNFLKVYSGEYDYILCANPDDDVGSDSIDEFIRKKLECDNANQDLC